jgi:hypothetical protein
MKTEQVPVLGDHLARQLNCGLLLTPDADENAEKLGAR